MNGIGTYLVNCTIDHGNLVLGVAGVAGCEVTHISETCMSQFVFPPVDCDPPSETTVASPTASNPTSFDVGIDGDQYGIGKEKRGASKSTWKRRKTALETVMRHWQEVWACKFS